MIDWLLDNPLWVLGAALFLRLVVLVLLAYRARAEAKRIQAETGSDGISNAAQKRFN